MDRVIWWGKSMYGGYYADIVKDDQYDGIHARTQKELKEKLEGIGINPVLSANKRYDNI